MFDERMDTLTPKPVRHSEQKVPMLKKRSIQNLYKTLRFLACHYIFQEQQKLLMIFGEDA